MLENNFNLESIDNVIQVIDNNIFKLSESQNNQFIKFYNLILEWNSKINLISRKETDVCNRHFLNSALLACLVEFRRSEKILDIGSGGGFPGIILKILFPESYFLLSDSILKKCTFLNSVICELDLKGIDVINSRVENLKPSFFKNFDKITSRAVAPLNDLLSWSENFLKKDGTFLALKGKNYMSEVESSKKRFNFDIEIKKYESLSFLNTSQESVLLLITNLRRSNKST